MSFYHAAQEHLRKVLTNVEHRINEAGTYVHRVLEEEKNENEEDDTIPRSLLGEDNSVEDEDLVEHESTAVLGNAGAGKTFIMLYVYKKAIERFLDSPEHPFPVFLECGLHLPSSDSVRRALRHQSKGLLERAFEEHPAGTHFFFDGLDEAYRRNRSFYNDFEIALRDLLGEAGESSKLLIACRRSEWKREWGVERLRGIRKLNADRLRREEYAQIISEREEREAFFTECQKRGIGSLLNLPLDGFYLARRFKESGRLPSSKSDYFDRRIDQRLQQSEARKSHQGAPSLRRLRDLAGLLACLVSFTKHEEWTPVEALDLLSASSLVGRGQPVTMREVEWVTQAPLFKTNLGESSAPRFSFRHERFREALCAEQLSGLSLRKQRLLLCTHLEGQERIVTDRRGVAMALMSSDRHFRDFLLESDPRTAFFGDLSLLSDKAKTKLLTDVIQGAVEREEVPWISIGGVGEDTELALQQCRLNDPGTFIAPYIAPGASYFEMLWGVSCSREWKGVPACNDRLVEIALDTDKRSTIRKRAVSAIAATSERRSVSRIKPLLGDEHDDVRGFALEAYRTVLKPTPTEYIEQVKAHPQRNPNLFCRLQTEVRSFGAALNQVELEEALACAFGSLAPSEALNSHLFRGLLERACELPEAAVPPALIAEVGFDIDIYSRDIGEVVVSLLKSRPALWEKVVRWVWYVALPARKSYHGKLAQWLAESRPAPKASQGGALLAPVTLIPWYKRNFQNNLCGPVAGNQESFPRQRGMVEWPPAETPTSPENPPIRLTEYEWLEVCGRLRDALRFTSDTVRRAFHGITVILSVMEDSGAVRFFYRPMDLARKLEEKQAEVAFVVENLQGRIREEFLDALLDAIASTTFKRKIAAARSVDLRPPCAQKRAPQSSYEITCPWVGPLLSLLPDTRLERHVAPPKLAELTECFAFSRPSWKADTSMLEMLRRADPARWKKVTRRLLDEGFVNADSLIDYLIELRAPFYLKRAHERLTQLRLRPRELGALLRYVEEFGADTPDSMQAVWDAYMQVRVRERWRESAQQWFSPGEQVWQFLAFNSKASIALLFVLMRAGDERGWFAFGKRLEEGYVPTRREHLPFRYRSDLKLPVPKTRQQASVYLDWYRRAKRALPGDDAFEIARDILGQLLEFWPSYLLAPLRSMRKARAYPGAKWNGGYFGSAEDRALSERSSRREPGTLLDFILKGYFFIVESDRDLFEVVCEAIEEVQGRLEGPAEGVAGFWNEGASPAEPKNEEGCQNVFWALLRSKLEAYGLSDVEEKYIRKHRADFWIEQPRRRKRPLRTLVEVKVARGSRAQIVDPVDEQLWAKYMKPESCGYGIYIAFWFKDGMRYPKPANWNSPDELKNSLQEMSERIGDRHGVKIASYVIDLTASYRAH